MKEVSAEHFLQYSAPFLEIPRSCSECTHYDNDHKYDNIIMQFFEKKSMIYHSQTILFSKCWKYYMIIYKRFVTNDEAHLDKGVQQVDGGPGAHDESYRRRLQHLGSVDDVRLSLYYLYCP